MTGNLLNQNFLGLGFKNKLKKIAPVRFNGLVSEKEKRQVFISFSPQRSGQHLILRWLCENLETIVHYNHCCFQRRNVFFNLTPKNGKRIIYNSGRIYENDWPGIDGMDNKVLNQFELSKFIYSLEDEPLSNPLVCRVIKNEKNISPLIILRDPFNWLASLIMKDGESIDNLLRKKESYIQCLEQALGVVDYLGADTCSINYNQFIVDFNYRQNICLKLGVVCLEKAENSLAEIPNFGRGSSFSGVNKDEQLLDSVCTRWVGMQSNVIYRRLLDDEKLLSLTDQFFGDLSYYYEIKNKLNF